MLLNFIPFCLLALSSAFAADVLKELVEINSGTNNRVGVNKVQDWLDGQLRSLGFSVEAIENPLGSERSGKLIVAELKGKDPSRFVTLIMHADTVFEPSSSFQRFAVKKADKVAAGPGVIDDKGGMLVVLEGLKTFLKSEAQPLYSIRVVSSPNEEVGSVGFLEYFRKFSQDTFLALGFEPALDDGSIIQSRRGNRWYRVKVVGQEAHAGRSHRDGVNACHELSTKLSEISKLTDYKADVTVSIGHIQGGQDKYNIVCGTAEAKIDTRFADLPSRDRLHERIASILSRPAVRSKMTGEATKIEYELEDDCPPYASSTASRPFIDRYLKILEATEGRKVSAKPGSGAGDTNYFSRVGIAIIDGLGAAGGKMHTSEEFIFLDSIRTRSKALARFLLEIKPQKDQGSGAPLFPSSKGGPRAAPTR